MMMMMMMMLVVVVVVGVITLIDNEEDEDLDGNHDDDDDDDDDHDHDDDDAADDDDDGDGKDDDYDHDDDDDDDGDDDNDGGIEEKTSQLIFGSEYPVLCPSSPDSWDLINLTLAQVSLPGSRVTSWKHSDRGEILVEGLACSGRSKSLCAMNSTIGPRTIIVGTQEMSLTTANCIILPHASLYHTSSRIRAEVEFQWNLHFFVPCCFRSESSDNHWKQTKIHVGWAETTKHFFGGPLVQEQLRVFCLAVGELGETSEGMKAIRNRLMVWKEELWQFPS